MPNVPPVIRMELQPLFQRIAIPADHGHWSYGMAEPQARKSEVRQAKAWQGRGVLPCG